MAKFLFVLLPLLTLALASPMQKHDKHMFRFGRRHLRGEKTTIQIQGSNDIPEKSVVWNLPKNFFRGENQVRIIDGQQVTVKVPMIGSIQQRIAGEYMHICGATVISKNRILTSATCLLGTPDDDELRFLAGNTDLTKMTQQSTFKGSDVHMKDTDSSDDDDIAVIDLASPLTLGDDVHAVALASSDGTYDYVVTSGWGSTSCNWTDTNSSPKDLRYAFGTQYDTDKCNKYLSDYFDSSMDIDEGQFCWEFTKAEKPGGPFPLSAGDAGGPLGGVKKTGSGEEVTQIGVFSWSPWDFEEMCPIKDAPQIYTKVSAYKDFIKQYAPDATFR